MSVVCNRYSQLISNLCFKSNHIYKAVINRFFLVINISLVLISCNSDSNSNEKKVFKYNSSTGITSLDPAFARTQENIRAVNQLFNGLVQLNEDLYVKPAIAKSWTISENNKVYTFTLRNDVFFHKSDVFKGGNRRVIASDFVYSFNRIIDSKTASDGAWIFNGIVDTTEPFSAPNDSTFVIKLLKPFAPLESMLTMAYCYVVPREAVEALGDDFGTQPIGTGPFAFSNWQEGIRLNFINNPKYFESTPSEKLPKVDAVSISFIQSKQTELLEFLQGRLNVFTGLESSFKDEILTAEGELKSKYSSNFNLSKIPFLNTEYLAFNVEDKSSPISNPAFRKAMSYAVDRNAMVKYLRNNVGIPANGGFIPKGLPGHLTFDETSYNPGRAKQILDSLNMSINQPIILTTTKDYLDLCILVQKNLDEVGIPLKIDVVPSSLLKQQKSAGDLAFFRSSWIADYPDAENYMACFFSNNKAPNGPNYTRFHQEEFDHLYQMLLSSKSQAGKKLLLTKMEMQLHNNTPFIVLFYDESIWIQSNNINNLQVNSLNHLDLRKVDFN
jgi:ABC-type transport system substrate-binding protein